ncbi:MAG: hypothetical protein NC122_10660 [Faecalibacterium sp.]|nr:hypothetical protein [Ruminococcus sp.]MCM1393179.1 hypothetical protein [Ruminococcus sp.]MCM1486651.1 hypothetical protein [Faecalibacterium sp.]
MWWYIGLFAVIACGFAMLMFVLWLSDVVERHTGSGKRIRKQNKQLIERNRQLAAENKKLKLQVEVAEQVVPVLKGNYNAAKFESSVFSRTDKPTVRERACAVREGK